MIGPGRPLRFLLLVAVGWVGLRAATGGWPAPPVVTVPPATGRLLLAGAEPPVAAAPRPVARSASMPEAASVS